MRKFLASLLLLATLLPFAAKAEELTVYDGTTTSQTVPMYVYYFDDFTKSQYVIPASDLTSMTGSAISSIKYYSTLTSAYTTAPEVDVYLKEVDYTTISAFVPKAEATIVFHGKVSFAANGEAVIEFNTPYEYNGGNLLVGVENSTDAGWKRVYFNGRTVSGASISGSTASSTGTISPIQQNFIPKTTFTYFNSIVLNTNPATLDMGYRPNNAWSAPYLFEIINSGLPGTISSIDASAPFVVNAEVPANLGNQESMEVEVSLAETTATGATTGEILLMLGDSKDFQTFDVTANIYTAETPDVWEMAQEVTTFPYTGTTPSNIYKNYDIPGAAATAKDAVYKVTFAEDVVLNASAANGTVAIYDENFGGKPGPMMDNVYTGPTASSNITPYDAWLYYDDGTYYGSMGAGGTIMWAVNFPASELTEALNCSVTKVKIYNPAGKAGGTSFISVYQDGMEIASQAFTFTGIGDWIEITLDAPVAFDNTKDLMIVAYNSGIDYPAAGCPYVDGIGDNGNLVSLDGGASWAPLTSYGDFPYTWMLRAYVQTPDGAKTKELSHFKGEVSHGELSQLVANPPIVTNPNGRADTPQGTSIEDMFVQAGTYYLVCASATDKFEVNISTSDVPAPEPAVVTAPEDGATNVTSPVNIQWTLGNYTSEMKVLFGTQVPPTDVLIDWTDQLVSSTTVSNLQNNRTYFIQILSRNATGETASEIYGFTTPIDPVEGFAVANENLYPGDAAEFTWEANRTLEGYNLYKDGELVNEGPITGTEYAVEGLEYNMTGYNFQIASLYSAGESLLSEPIVVKMTGFGNVSGTVYEQDETTVVPNVTVEFRGTDQYGADQSFTFTTDENGAYTGEVLAGTYQTYAYSDIYQESPGPAVTVAYGDELEGIDIIITEFYFPLGQIRATEQTDENNVLVEWDWTPGEMVVDFETGDFSQAEFTLPATYPWAITTTNPHDGTYCMKSTCEGVASGVSEIEVTVDVPFEAKMGFWVRTSSETNYDKFHFYIDGVEQGAALSGNNPYAYKEFAVAQGTHTYKWAYQKDGSVNSNDDCIYVDDITMYRQDIPAPPVVGAIDYNFDDGTLMDWTNIDADGDGNVWVSSSNPGIYHNAGVNLSGTGHNSSEAYVISGSYANGTGQALHPDNYLVSPQISAEDGALIRFYACAQDASYAAEVFGVAVSTAGNTSATDFTTIQTWTMTAKGPQGRTAESERDIRGAKQGAWYEYTVDLSDYAGQDIYVAIRHYNCTDQFILNVDDITLATGGSKNIVRDERSFQHFNLYRRDIKDGEETAEAVCIAQPAADVFEYTDEAWASLPYGAYQWGIQAYYEGNAPAKSRDEFTYDFEGDLDGWTVLTINAGEGEWVHSNDNPGGYDYTSHAHGGTGFAMCYSFVDYVGSFDTDSYLISPQKYSLDGSSTISFWADNANDDYPEEFSVCISTAANPTSAADFTQVWGGEAKGKAKGGEMVRHTTNRYDNWRSHSVDLSAYAGQEVWIAFHDVNYDAYEIWIDDVTITAGGGAPLPPPIPTPTGDGLSEILWSNTIEKDMYSTVTVNVTLNNGQSPAGVSVALGDNTGTMDNTGTLVFDNVRKGEYELAVTMAEFADHNETVMINEDEQTINVTLMEIVGPVADLYVSPTGWAMWSGATNGGGTTPVGPVTPVTTTTYGFEGTMDGWTTIDADGDNHNWQLGSVLMAGYLIPSHGGADCVSSQSYDGQTSMALHPDNYLVSPAKAAYTEISFWACAQDASYAAEHFGVAVSTTGNTNAADFTTIWEATMTAKDGGKAGNYASRSREGKEGTWYQYTVDLSDYAGQDIWVAIRHFNCTDMFYIDVDDVTLAGSAKSGAKADRGALSFKVMLDGAYEGETTNGYFQHNVEGFEEGSVHTTSVAGIYATGMGDWTDYTWTYTSCENFAGASNVTAEQSENVVNIAWTMPDAPGPGPGPTPPGGGSTFTEDFEGSLNGWTVLTINSDGGEWVHSSANPGGYDYASHAHGGAGFALCYSFVDYVGAFNTDSYLITPQAYDIVAGSTLTFFADNANDSYPENFSVCVSTAATPSSAADFTNVWSGGAKGKGNGGAAVRHTNDRYDNWRAHSVDLSAYAGQTVWIAFHDVNYDAYEIWIDDVELSTGTKGGRAMWDFVNNFSGSSAGQQAVATDGTYIYTASWQDSPAGGYTFYQYDLEGNFIEGFNIAGATGIRDLTTDGEYFYGSSGGAQIFCMDFTTRTLVSTINCSGLTSRHLSYDPERDGFWSGNWSTLALYSRTGALIQSGPAPTSAYGSAYYKDADDVEHLYLFCQISPEGSSATTNRVEVIDYNITTNTLGATPLHVCSDIPGYDPANGIAGGCFIGSYNGQTCFFSNVQQSPNLIGIYELDGNGTPGPGPGPTPGEFGILGAYVFRNGELISGTTPLTTSTFVDNNAPAGDNEYCVRVVYDGALDTTYFAMSCPVCAEVEYECIPVNNLVAEYTYNSSDDYGVTLTWECEHAGDVLYYNIYYSDTIVSGITELEYYVEMTGNPGEYTYSVTAVYSNCESEPVYADVNVTSVNDINGKVVLYPNPTNSTVTIEATGMKHITVVNALGQVVYDTDLTADMTQLNLGQYKPGVYMVRINTEEGVSVKRVTVVK